METGVRSIRSDVLHSYFDGIRPRRPKEWQYVVLLEKIAEYRATPRIDTPEFVDRAVVLGPVNRSGLILMSLQLKGNGGVFIIPVTESVLRLGAVSRSYFGYLLFEDNAAHDGADNDGRSNNLQQ